MHFSARMEPALSTPKRGDRMARIVLLAAADAAAQTEDPEKPSTQQVLQWKDPFPTPPSASRLPIWGSPFPKAYGGQLGQGSSLAVATASISNHFGSGGTSITILDTPPRVESKTKRQQKQVKKRILENPNSSPCFVTPDKPTLTYSSPPPGAPAKKKRLSATCFDSPPAPKKVL